MKLEDLSKANELKIKLERYEEIIDKLPRASYLSRIYQRERDEVIRELKELGVEV